MADDVEFIIDSFMPDGRRFREQSMSEEEQLKKYVEEGLCSRKRRPSGMNESMMNSTSSATDLTTESMLSSVSSGHERFFFWYLAKLAPLHYLRCAAHHLHRLGCASW